MPEIHLDMPVYEILEIKPHAKDLLFEYGLLSEGENVQSLQTLQEAASARGMEDDRFEEMVEKLMEI